jgi:hypothetical protein
MSKVDTLTISSLLKLLSANGLYMLLYGWLFGMSMLFPALSESLLRPCLIALWITFFGGVFVFFALDVGR